MARDGEIPAIFNPRRARAPSAVFTSGDPINGPFTAVPQITHSDSLTSGQQDGCDSSAAAGVLIQEPGAVNQTVRPPGWLHSCKASCCSELMQKMYFGVCVTVLVTASWVGATHCIKFLYLKRSARHHFAATLGPSSRLTNSSNQHGVRYDAPFFTTWFCTNWAVLFFPIYALVRMATGKCESPTDIFAESLRGFREKGFTAGRFLSRCSLFCVLWVATSYVYVHSLRVLLATDVMALFATNVASVYLLSWVILHEQFVGVRIVAVILCDTGIALLAYMDGITGSPTLGGVVLAAAAAAGYAVYKVLFRKVIGEATHAQTALFFSLLGLLNAALLWPLCLALYFTGAETLPWDKLPWPVLLAASGLLLVFNLLTHFSMAVTYNLFVTLGLITAVPVSAALDVVLYGATFAGMKLAGVILIAVGFFLVMFPDNWPTYITRLLRNIIMLSHSARWGRKARPGTAAGARRDAVDYRTGYIRSHLRSPSGRVR